MMEPRLLTCASQASDRTKRHSSKVKVLPHIRDVIATLLATTALFVLVGCERWALDRQMEELCTKDGGIKVYEKIILPAKEFEALKSHVSIAKSTEDYYGPDYLYIRTREILVGAHANAQKGEGQLTRWHHAIYRRTDGRLLGESVSYSRAGGDGYTFGFQPSGRNCPIAKSALDQLVFATK